MGGQGLGQFGLQGEGIAVAAQAAANGEFCLNAAQPSAQSQAERTEQMRAIQGAEGQLVAQRGPAGLGAEGDMQAHRLEQAQRLCHQQGRGIGQRHEAQAGQPCGGAVPAAGRGKNGAVWHFRRLSARPGGEGRCWRAAIGPL